MKGDLDSNLKNWPGCGFLATGKSPVSPLLLLEESKPLSTMGK
jgi:hypothetical protein